MIPPHLIDRGIEAIVRRREAELGVRFVVVDVNDPEPVGASTAPDVDRRDNREGEGR